MRRQWLLAILILIYCWHTLSRMKLRAILGGMRTEGSSICVLLDGIGAHPFSLAVVVVLVALMDAGGPYTSIPQ